MTLGFGRGKTKLYNGEQIWTSRYNTKTAAVGLSLTGSLDTNLKSLSFLRSRHITVYPTMALDRPETGKTEIVTESSEMTVVQTSPRRPPSVPHIPPRPSMRQRRPTRTPRRPDRFSRRDPGGVRVVLRGVAKAPKTARRPEHRDELHLAGYPRRQGQCHGVFSLLTIDRR